MLKGIKHMNWNKKSLFAIQLAHLCGLEFEVSGGKIIRTKNGSREAATPREPGHKNTLQCKYNTTKGGL